MNDGGPLSFAVSLPYDVAVQHGRDLGWREIAMKVEVFCVRRFVAVAEIDPTRWGRPLGREDEGYVVTSGIGRGLLDLVDREVLDGDSLDGMVGVSEFGAIEFGGGGPCGEDGGVGVALVDEVDGALVEDDHVAVGEIVFRGKGVGWVDPETGEEGCGAECGESPPLAEMTMPDGYADEEDERIHREQIAGEQGASEDREGDPVGDEDDCNGFELHFGKRRRRGGSDGDEENGNGTDDGHEHVHVRRQVEETMPETEGDAVDAQVCCGVVAEELGIAEDEASVVVVIPVPRYQAGGSARSRARPATSGESRRGRGLRCDRG